MKRAMDLAGRIIFTVVLLLLGTGLLIALATNLPHTVQGWLFYIAVFLLCPLLVGFTIRAVWEKP